MCEQYYPNTLKDIPIWALWRLEPDQKDRMMKVPYSPHYNGHASSAKPESWGTFSEAVKKFESRLGYYNGISLIISKDYGLVFIDIDHCVGEGGVLNETASDVVGSFGSQFIEYSQSGTGVHIIAKGTIPKNFKNSKNGVEMYADKRFCSLTGNAIVKGEPIEDQRAIDYVYQKYKTPERIIKCVKTGNRALQKNDEWVIKHASRRGKFNNLYNGDWSSMGYVSQSDAEFALCIILAYWTDRNANQIDRIVRSSGLYRDKWERSGYRETTIQKAIDSCIVSWTEDVHQKRVERGERLASTLRERWDS